MEEIEQKKERKRNSQVRMVEVVKSRQLASSDPTLSRPLPIYELEDNHFFAESLAHTLLLPNVVSLSSSPLLSPSFSPSSLSNSSSDQFAKSTNHLILCDKSPYSIFAPQSELSLSGWFALPPLYHSSSNSPFFFSCFMCANIIYFRRTSKFPPSPSQRIFR